MNYCPKGHSIPDNALACPDCAMARGDEALYNLQLEFLRKAASGEVNYTLRVAKGADRHVLMYTSYTRTFCGRELKGKPRIGYEPYSADALSHVCTGCRIALTSALKEAIAQ
jgi:hypothetical protein